MRSSQLPRLSVFVLALFLPLASARAVDPNATIMAQKLQDVADRLGELADFDKLGTNLPFTSLNPSDALKLADLFKDSLRKTLQDALDAGIDSCAELADAIDGGDGAGHSQDFSVGPVTVTLSNASVSCGSAPFTVGFTVHAQVTIHPTLGIVLPDSGINLSGGDFSVTVTLDTTLNFQLDTSESDAALAFALVTPPIAAASPSIEVGVTATGQITAFAGLVGIADIDVTGAAHLDVDIGIEFTDPDDNGLLTVDELANTSFADLVTVVYREEAGNEVEFMLELDSALIAGSDGASITLVHADLSGFTGDLDLPGDVTVDLGLDLANFTNISPSTILSGLSSLAASIGGIQLIADVDVPFMDVSLRETFEFVQPIVDFVRTQSDLAIACGTIDDNPPRGNISNLKNGDHFFCQATSLAIPVEFEWKLGGNVLFVSDASVLTDPSTIGTNPTVTVEFQMDFVDADSNATQRPDIEIDFRNDLSQPLRKASRAFLSADELRDKLATLGGFDPSVINQTYDASSKTLTYHLLKTFDPEVFGDDPATELTNLDFSDRLKEKTGLTNLSASASSDASVRIDPGPIKLELTFGIILVDDVARITPADLDVPDSMDRFFIQVRTGDGEYELEADTTVTVDPLELKGQVGFLKVSLIGDAEANLENNTTAFEVGRGDSSKPMLAIDIEPPAGGIEITGATTIPNAILLTDLLQDVSGAIMPHFNVKMTGGLKITAQTTSPPLSVTGTVGINWPNVIEGTWPDVKLSTPTFTGDFAESFKVFDTDPSQFGTATTAGEGVCDNDDSMCVLDADCGDGNECVNDTLLDAAGIDFRTGTCTESTVECTTDADCTGATNTCRARVLGRTLRNLTDGSECVITEIVEDHKLSCTLGGGGENTWNLNDKYELVGNPLDLLSIILDNLDELVKGIDNLTGAGIGDVFSTKLPLIGVSPEEIIAFTTQLETALEKIRSGEPDAAIACTWNSSDARPDQPSDNLAGLPSQGMRCDNDVKVLCAVDEDCPAGGTCAAFVTKLQCNAVIDALESGDMVTSVSWELIDPAAGSTTGPTNTPGVETVNPIPAGSADFNLPGGGTIGTDFIIRVTYETNKSGKRTGELPSEALSLQSLERALENNLGLPEIAIKLEIDDLPPPGSTTPDNIQDLIIRLTFGECTGKTCFGGTDDGMLCDTVADCSGGGACEGNSISTIVCDPTSDRIVPQRNLRFNLGLESLEADALDGLIGVDGDDPSFKLQYVARATLDLAIPLDPTFSGNAIVVLDTSGVTAIVGAVADSPSDNPTLRVSAGPGELKLVGSAKVGASFTLKPCTKGEASCGNGSTDGIDSTDNNETLTISDFLSFLTPKLDGGAGMPFDCGTVTVASVLTGTHDGSDGDKGVSDANAAVVGCDQDPDVACPDAALGSDQIGAEVRKLNSDGSVDVRCDATHLIGGKLMCLTSGSQPKACSTGGGSCTGDSDCPDGETCDDTDCADASDCDAGEVCNGGDCLVAAFTWNAGDSFEVVDASPGIETPLLGDACARFDLVLEVDGIGDTTLGVIGFKAEDIESPDSLKTFDDWYAHASLDSEGALKKLLSADLALKLLFEGLRFIVRQMDAILEGGSPKLNIPILGKRFDGGSGVCGKLDDKSGGGVIGVLDSLESLLVDSSTFDEITNVIRFGSTDESGTSGLLNELGDLLQDTDDDNAGADPDKNDIVVEFDCGGSPCGAADSLTDLDDIRIRFLMGQGDAPSGSAGCTGDNCGTGDDIPFELGIPGVPFGFTKNTMLSPEAGWRLLVDFGLNRKKGPYIVAGGDNHGSDPELTIGASIKLVGTESCDDEVGVGELDDDYAADPGKCLKAELAFFDAIIRTNPDNPTGVSLLTTLDIQGADKIGFCQLTNGDVALDVSLSGDIVLDARFRTEFTGADAQLPSVLGVINVTFPGFSVGFNSAEGTRAEFDSLDSLDISFNHLYLDAGNFFSGFMCELLKPIQKATKPLTPIIDTVRAPLPLVSDLSEMVGGPKVTLFSLMILANDGKPIPMIENLIELIEYANSLDCSGEDILIPLGGTIGGSFTVDKTKALAKKPTADKAKEFIKKANTERQKQLKQRVLKSSSNASAGKTPSSFSFPFLEDSSQIFGMIMGQDMTLVRWDAGEMTATASLAVTYCCIPVGPVPVGVFIELSATLKGRFAMGYDTFGLRQAFMRKKLTGGSAIDLLEGVFIDDLDASGSDVPEISLIGEVRAGAGVDIGFAAAGVDGGVRMTVDFNLDDRPDPDGKLRLSEVVSKLSNPICLFDVSGKLEAFLGAWVRIGFEWFSKSWRFDILRITLLEFSAACSPPEPAPATPDGGTLRINIGSRAKFRNFNEDEKEEEVLLRQMTIAEKNGTATVSVSLMGFIEEYKNISLIVIDGGSENDVISLREGTVRMPKSQCVAPAEMLKSCSGNGQACSRSDECPGTETCDEPAGDPSTPIECSIPFTVRAQISGGGGDDQINGGAGDDTLNGNDGNDKINGGNGNDTINGGNQDDVLAGGAGNDTINGGNHNDTITGGGDDCPGSCRMHNGFMVGDIINGGDGDDDINGGPGTNKLDDETQVVTLGQNPDGNDWITGGAGNDIIQGFFGDDVIYGDGVMSCQSAGTATDGRDKIDGGPGNDRLFGGGGDDTIGGEQGDDIICGNGGNDMLEGDALDATEVESGDDDIFGGPGHDQLFGRFGHDLLFGDDGNDALYGNQGPDDLIGGRGRDILVGGLGRDILLGDGEMIDDLAGAGNSVLNHSTHSHNVSDAVLLADIIVGNNAETCDPNTPNCGPRVPSCAVGLNFFVQPITPLIACSTSADCADGQFCILVLDDSATVQNACATEVGPMLVGIAGESNATPTANSDCLFGGDEADLLFGEGGNDVMFGDGAEGECEFVAGFDHGDYMEGNSGDDFMRGGLDDDTMFGNGGDDAMFGDAGEDSMFGCDLETINCHGESDKDTMRGGKGDDHMEGNQGDDLMFGDAGEDDMIGGSSVTNRNDGDDDMFGNSGKDVMLGDNGSITRPGGTSPVDGTIIRTVTLFHLDCSDNALAGDDTMNGNTGNDQMYGGCENDVMHGDNGDDYMEGNGDDDLMLGDLGQDDMIGGTSQDGGGHPDGADTMWGGDGTETTAGVGVGVASNEIHDVLIGDNGSITRPTETVGPVVQWITDDFADDTQGVIRRVITLFDVPTVLDPLPGIITGIDTIHGELGRDLIFGGGNDDLLHGDAGHDYLEGNAGSDDIWGDQGQDDIVGGTGRKTSNDGATAVDGRLDGNDNLYGGDNVADLTADYDVIIGDNGTIIRAVDGEGKWFVNTFNDAFRRGPTLLDIGMVGNEAGDGTSGSDTILGEGDDDLLFGQGAGDFMFGGTGDDYMEGNAADDDMEGNEGNDDMVGGTGRIDINGVYLPDDDDLIATKGVDGRLDGADTMLGNEGFDVLAGDNALIVRRLTDGKWKPNSFNGGMEHLTRVLLDIDGHPDASGADTMFGGHEPADVLAAICTTMDDCGDAQCCFRGHCALEGVAVLSDDDDLMYGQGGDDCMHGNDGDDFMEGNADSDRMVGGADEDDMIGGTVQDSVGDGCDDMYGNNADDVMIGDNGNITRQLIDNQGHPDHGTWLRDLNTTAVLRDVFLFDVETVDISISDVFSGGDVMRGNDGNDRMFGQGGNDTMHGGANFDYMEGNHASDLMFGDDGEDDMIGGGSAIDGVIARNSIGNGLLDDEDELHGGEGGDVMTGDNARLNRRLDSGGIWLVDPNVDDVFRDVVLFDVESVVGSDINQDTSGSDLMFGNDGRDLMFGQGNTLIDADGDGRFNEDPADGRDNDRDGREESGALVYDCGDRSDNDKDGFVDSNDPQCLASIDEDGGGDEMHGGLGVDYMEGNHGSDWMFGDQGEDDMIGGSSAGDGVIGGGVPPTNLRDGDDTMTGGEEDDVMIGDNGVIERVVESGIWRRHAGGPFDLAVRVVTMVHVPEQEGAFGHDFMSGNSGDDDMYGQQGDDFMEGNDGEDAMIGDLGQITNRVEDGSNEAAIGTTVIRSNDPFFEDRIFAGGTMTRMVELFSFLDTDGADGRDVMLGNLGRDTLHGCAGNDIMNGDGEDPTSTAAAPTPDDDDFFPGREHEDHLFGGDGDDVMWGGLGHDHLWGGHGNDHLDVRPRVASKVTAPDTPEWFTWGEPHHYQGLDIIHGGWGQDAMQANLFESGPPLADRLIDWVGGHDVFYVCPGAYGEGTISRIGSPSLQRFLEDLARGDGALAPAAQGTSGFRELSYVFARDRKSNATPLHPDHPGHFTCDEEELSGNSGAVGDAGGSDDGGLTPSESKLRREKPQLRILRKPE